MTRDTACWLAQIDPRSKPFCERSDPGRVSWPGRGGDEVSVDMSRCEVGIGIDVGCTSQLDLRSNRRIATAFSPVEHPGSRQDLRTMANRRDRFAVAIEGLDDFNHPLIEAQVLGSPASWDHQPVEAIGVDFGKIAVEHKSMTRLF